MHYLAADQKNKEILLIYRQALSVFGPGKNADFRTIRPGAPGNYELPLLALNEIMKKNTRNLCRDADFYKWLSE